MKLLYKHHLGICNKLKDVRFLDKRDSNGKPKWAKEEKKYVNQVIASKVSAASTVLEMLVNNGGNTSKKRLLWAKGLKKGNQIYCMALAQQDDIGDMKYVDDNDLKYMKMQARKVLKSSKQ